MITHNLHNLFRQKTKDERRKTSLKRLVLPFVFILLPFTLKAQDSIPAKMSVSEQKNLDFQKLFFRALSEKAIKNHQKAIEILEEANQIIPNDIAVLFEFSKNYYSLNKTLEATEYANQALEIEPNNLWILEHLVSVYRKDLNFSDAITIQKKIAKNHPKKKYPLVFLHLQNKDGNAALQTLNELEESKLLTSRLRKIKASLEKGKRKKRPKRITAKIKKTDVKKDFETNKSYPSLKNLLKKLDAENATDLLKYSEQGMSLFPAQPFVYFMNGKAHNNQKEYKKALESLQNGIDFVIDDRKMEINFYKEMAKAYKGMGNLKQADKFLKKAK